MTPHDAAVGYGERSWRVVPLHYPVDLGGCSCRRPGCGSVGKHPRPKAWQDKATDDLDTIDRWWAKDARSNVGIATGGPARLVVVDLDPKDNGVANFAALVERHGELPPTCTVETGSGGVHYYFTAPEGVEVRNSASKLARGVDIRAEGGQVVAPPSMHASGNPYRWAISPDDEEPAELPAWILKLIVKASPAKGRDDHGDAEVVEGGRNDWLTSKAGVLRRAGFDEDAIRAALVRENRAKCRPPLEDDEVDKIAASVSSYAPGRALPEAPDDWRNKLRPKLDRKGNPTGEYQPTRRNVGLVLTHDKRWRGRIWLDEARAQAKLGDRAITDSDLVGIADDLDRFYGWAKLAIGTVHEAVGGVAERNRVDVLGDWLRGLSWDGERRTGTWLRDALGVEDNALTRAYARRFLIQAVARALRPGCQADSVLILVGPQGTGKSTAFRLLAGDDWFSDTVVDLRSRDRFAQINRAWIYEFAELASFRNSRSDSIKAFLTSREDVYRPPYARTEIHHRRRVCFVASTNDAEFLSDYTGSRRFWPVKVGKLDRGWLLDNREALWAEAVADYKAGESWHLSDAEEAWRIFEARQYQERDPWTELVEAWATDRAIPFTTAAALKDACKVPVERQDMRAMSRVASILRALGFVSADGTTIVDARQVKARVWKMPGTVHAIHDDELEDDDDEEGYGR